MTNQRWLGDRPLDRRKPQLSEHEQDDEETKTANPYGADADAMQPGECAHADQHHALLLPFPGGHPARPAAASFNHHTHAVRSLRAPSPVARRRERSYFAFTPDAPVAGRADLCFDHSILRPSGDDYAPFDRHRRTPRQHPHFLQDEHGLPPSPHPGDGHFQHHRTHPSTHTSMDAQDDATAQPLYRQPCALPTYPRKASLAFILDHPGHTTDHEHIPHHDDHASIKSHSAVGSNQSPHQSLRQQQQHNSVHAHEEEEHFREEADDNQSDVSVDDTAHGRSDATSPVSNKDTGGAARRPIKKSRICKVENCTRYVVNKGLCIGHGGGKRCAVSGCTSSAKNAGVCWKHGGSTKCTIEGCDNRAKSRGVCWSHGGGRKCKEEGCTKTAVSNGLCWAHGGGKRCIVEGCKKPAYERNGNLCTLHKASPTAAS